MSTRLAILVATTTLATALTACGGSNFAGNSKKTQADEASGDATRSATATAPATSTAPGTGGSVGGAASSDLAAPADATPEQKAIGRCLAQWGKSAPFDASIYQNYQHIDAAVSILGGGSSYAVEDTQATDQPALIVVSAAVSVLGSTRYALMNPNGWYCIMTDVNVESKTEIDLQCKAHLAGSKVQVNVGSDADANSAVGVNVLSDVKVVREPAEGQTGC